MLVSHFDSSEESGEPTGANGEENRQAGRSPESGEQLLEAILRVVKEKTGHDFSSYKKSTVERRIARRMTVNELDSRQSYLALLEESQLEAHALYQEMLIGVTAFFRDPEAFEVLRTELVPKLFAAADPEEPVRIWHACCATGEEVYSLAMLVREYLDAQGLSNKVLIFATDLDEVAVSRARAGCYPEGGCTGLDEGRLARFFTRVEGGYQVAKSLREMIVFARHNLIKDPPFSRLDLLVCRNFLIYITPDLQRRLIALFHRVVRPGGFLFLGSSETLGSHADLFLPVDKKWKIFSRHCSGVRTESSLIFAAPAALAGSRRPADEGGCQAQTPGQSVEKLLMERYSPPCVIVNDRYEVVHVSTRSSRFLEVPLGEPTRDLLRMVREGLRPALRAAIHKALTEQTQVVFRGQRLKDDSGPLTVDVLVEPLGDAHAPRRLAMVIFESVSPAALQASPPAAGHPPLPGDERSKDLLIRQLEFQSTNEELQSTNEELETSKKELQSLNEELLTVNAELCGKVEELKRANDDTENFLNSAGIATVFLDPQLQVMRFTPTMARLFNLIAADCGRPFRHLCGRFDWSSVSGDLERVLSGEKSVEREVRDQETGRYYLLRMLPYRTCEGGVEGVVLTLVDITEPKLAEQSLVESERRYRHLFAHLQDGFAFCRMLFDDCGAPADFVYLEVNAAFVELTGLKEVAGRKASEVMPGIGDSSPELFEILGRVALTGLSERCELYCQPLDCWLSISAYSPQRGSFVAIFDDISQRKRAEKQLLEYRKIIECARDMVYVFDRSFRYLLANRAYLEYRGSGCGDLVGRTLCEVLGAETFAEIEPRVEECLLRGEASFETQFHYPSRGLRDISVSYTAIEEGEVVTRIACVIRDITESRQMQEQLRQSQKMEAIGTLAGGIAHDFNNILTVISGYACLIQMDDQKADIPAMAAEILNSVDRAAEMTQGLLAFSRKQQVNLAAVDLNFILISINKSLSRLINEDIELAVRVTEAPLFAMADKGQLELVIINLAVNARDAMPEGGSLQIGSEQVEIGAEEAGLERGAAGSYGLITVSDNGTGINDKLQERVFEPFFTTKEVGKGTGLGLSMVYGIIKKHNGFIKMQSVPGVGTSFRIYLPLCQGRSVAEQPGSKGCQAAGSETILLVEDDEAIRTMTRRLLEQHGYRVFTAQNGEEALRVFAEQRNLIQLLITDVIMPRMNGRELHRQICQLSPQLPTIFMSGYAADVLTQQGFCQEKLSYLPKPIRSETLFEKIREVLPAREQDALQTPFGNPA